MRLEQLSYLIEVYQAASISLAAEHVYISQPALSSSISKLEDELGVHLLKRTNEGVYPTELGEVIIRKAQKIMETVEEIRALAKENALELSGNISIAVEQNVNMALMPKVLTNFKQIYPKVNIMQKVGESNNILRDIESGKADFGIVIQTGEVSKAKDINSKDLFTDRLVVITGEGNPIAAAGAITLDEALKQPIILMNTEYMTNCGISEILHKYGEFNVAFRVDNIPLLIRLLRQVKCIAFIPKCVICEYTQFNGVAFLDIEDILLDISIVMIWSNRHHLSMVERELIKVIRAAEYK